MTSNAFYFILEALSVFSRYLVFVLTFWSVEKQLDHKDKTDFKIYDVTTWLTCNYNTYIAQYLTK